MGIADWLNKMRILKKSKKKISYTLNFKGYYKSADGIPESHGVYAAFTLDETETPKLLYIGRAYKTNNLKKRIQEHFDNDHNSAKWEAHYDPEKETICYSYAEIDDDDIIPDIEKTLINKNKPEINCQNMEGNNIDALFVILTCVGNKACLKSLAVLIKGMNY